MINFTLYKKGLLGSLKMLLIFMSVLTMYFLIIVSMFDPSLGSVLNELTGAMPELMAMFGMNQSSVTMLGFLSSYLYGFIMLIFPMIFSILCANRLIAGHVDKGSMVYLLAAPIKRKSIAFTQMKVLASGIFALMLYASAIGIIACEASFKGELAIKKFILLNVGALCLQLFISGICFLCSCIFNDTKYSIGFGAGIPALAFIIQMLANADNKLEKVKYATFFTLFSPDGIASGEKSAVLGMIALFVGAVILFISAIAIFSKKDLHI